MVHVADNIVQQIGSRAFQMIGARYFVSDDTSLTFTVGRNSKGVTHITVTLDPSDTYTVSAFRLYGTRKRDVASQSLVFAGDLCSTIEALTGMRTNL